MSDNAIVSAFHNYRGAMVDLDEKIAVEADALRDAQQRLLGDLRRSGIESGDRVILAIGNGPRFVAALVAVVEAGGSPLLLHADTPPAEIERTAERWQVRAVLTDKPSPALEEISPAARDLGDDGWNHYLWCDRSQKLASGLNFPLLPGAPLHPTSGTTGVPKIAIRHDAAAVADAEHYIETIGIDADDTFLNVAPMSHGYAFGCGVMASLVSGSRIVSMRRFNPRQVERAFAEHPITIFPAVPAMVDMMVVGRGVQFRRPPRRLLTAGAPLSIRTARDAREKLGVFACPLYGTTENGGITVAMQADENIGCCVGPAMNRVETRLRTLPRQEDGSDEELTVLEIRSDSMMMGYLSPDGVDTSMLDDGWFCTEDLAWYGDDGWINLRGRQSDMINVFGMKVVPSEVEEVIAAFPGVGDVKVYAGRHRSGSQIVKAAIAAEETFDVAALRKHCEDQLIHYKRPEIITRLDAVPRSPMGKILKDQLP